MKKKILIIDDDPGLGEIFKRALEEKQYEVLLAETATKGIELAKSTLPDLILLDFMLPDFNGTQALKKLKADPLTKDIPVAILSNFGQEERIKETLNEGALDFWIKYQLGTEDLLYKVGSVLNKNEPKENQP